MTNKEFLTSMITMIKNLDYIKPDAIPKNLAIQLQIMSDFPTEIDSLLGTNYYLKKMKDSILLLALITLPIYTDMTAMRIEIGLIINNSKIR